MGLDMYLVGKKFIWHDEEFTVKPDITEGYKLRELQIDIMYWRKANSIHMWFVNNIQKGTDDCEEYYVSEEKLKELYDTVCTVIDDHNKASKLLPTQSGFFFGGTDYNEWYFKDLERTKEELDKLLKSTIHKTFSIYYHSSW